MAFIEKIEITALSSAFKSPLLYLVFALIASPAFFIEHNISVFALVALAFIFALILIIDVKEYIIPDSCQIAFFAVSCIILYFSDDRLVLNSILGAVFAGGMFFGIYYVYEKIIKKSALGFGDVKLLGNVGFLLGLFSFNYFLWILTVISCSFLLVRLFIKNKNKLIPYGPFIVISTWICLLFEQDLELYSIKLMSTILN